ncbi:Ni/Fe-hydrogenase cytochrome b subunit [Carboxydochorda subterranea]|uniref:Ni/Fe-hydrogenase cytochrome b subunit n=1 Tax=Carboxydichorda subterranea TaxID=3109565 RepID=A0ABZ1C0U3_9FIRM|nr:Ni/Fe-hydrogenase cytochrome b subunit [Limnochorda sp. L945t]WRP18366.1 Ni/Fe-hydrogenase cytochrome b subunit [Limnochorda sp. L945t]
MKAEARWIPGRSRERSTTEKLVELGWGRLALWALALTGGLAMVYRLVRGLGATTHLNDAWPWGWWIAFDVMGGVALAAGAFVVAAWVHLFGKHRYAPLARPAVLTGFLGYLMVIAGLLMDLGRPYRIWHPIVMWQPHSVMFEVAWCVMVYTTVLAFEFSPVALEGLGWHRACRAVRRALVPMVILGVVCSVLHQSSLGSLLLIATYRMDPLWYSPLLPVLFFVSAVAAGLGMIQLEAAAASRVYRHRVEPELVEGLARGMAWMLALYLALRLGDWVSRGQGPWTRPVSLESVAAGLEVLVGAALPALVMSRKSWRQSARARLVAAGLAVVGVIANRIDSVLVSMRAGAGAAYVPSLLELWVTGAIVAAGVLGYDWVARHWPLFVEEPEALPGEARAQESRRPVGVTAS